MTLYLGILLLNVTEREKATAIISYLPNASHQWTGNTCMSRHLGMVTTLRAFEYIFVSGGFDR